MQALDNDTIDVLVNVFTTEEDYEECAVVLRVAPDTWHIKAVPNRHSDKKNHFRIMREDVNLQDGESIVAVVHTHTRPGEVEPSYDDVKSLPDGLLGIVVHPRTGSWTAYDNKVGVLAFKAGDHPHLKDRNSR